MAVILCKTHGRSFCFLVCPHIIEDKQLDRPPNKFFTIRYYLGNFAEDKNAPMTFPFHYCKKCMELYDFPEESQRYSEEDMPEEEFDKKFSAVDDKFQLVCVECYKDFIQVGKNIR